MDGGAERIEDDIALRAVRAQARRIFLKGIAWTVIIMTVVMVLP
jgi:hypothetical protein